MNRIKKIYEVHIPAYLTGDRVWDSSIIRIEKFDTKKEAYAWLSELGIDESDDRVMIYRFSSYTREGAYA